MRIYNSLTRQKQEFEPLSHPKINIYTCGVTVYDECHLGHARSLYIFDVIRRYLEYKYGEDNVNFVRNITDIDDKIINRAGELNTDWKDLVEKYIDSYNRDLELLGIRKGMLDKDREEPRATKNIPDMVRYITGLIDKGYAYQAGGDVYFSVRKFSDYGRLSGQDLEQIQAGARVAPGEKKKDPLDFALWKSSKEGEPSWNSPWGKGRPGWHIECSVMSQKFLKTDTLDIHGGGRDLIFPHHENEIAQAEALTGRPFARFWVHHGLLTINGQKMAKSAGNFITIKDFVSRYNHPDLLKLFFLSAHYSHPIDYNQQKLEEAKKQNKIFDDFFQKINNWCWLGGVKKPDFPEVDKTMIDNICLKFQEAMDNDFNTPQALAAFFELIDLGAEFVSLDIEEGFGYVRSKAEEFFGILGLKKRPKGELNPEIKELVKDRGSARRDKDFQKADAIRKEIEDKYHGLLMDTANGITFIEK